MRAVTLMVLVSAITAGSVWAQVATPPAPPANKLAAAAAAPIPPNPAAKKALVQIAILLDTSGSMNGLIDQAKTELWRIVNEVAKIKVDGASPDVQVALYHYGTPSLGAENGYIKQLVPLTEDLDKVSDELFKLRTAGGDEYCGMVIQKAVEELKWDNTPGVYKMIFI